MQVNQGNLTQSSEDLFITGKYLNSFYLILLVFQWTKNFVNKTCEFDLAILLNPEDNAYYSWGCMITGEYLTVNSLTSFNLNANFVCLILSSTCCLTLCWYK